MLRLHENVGVNMPLAKFTVLGSTCIDEGAGRSQAMFIFSYVCRVFGVFKFSNGEGGVWEAHIGFSPASGLTVRIGRCAAIDVLVTMGFGSMDTTTV